MSLLRAVKLCRTRQRLHRDAAQTHRRMLHTSGTKDATSVTFPARVNSAGDAPLLAPVFSPMMHVVSSKSHGKTRFNVCKTLVQLNSYTTSSVYHFASCVAAEAPVSVALYVDKWRRLVWPAVKRVRTPLRTQVHTSRHVITSRQV